MNSNYFRLSQVYFAYFAILGVTAHYFGLYLSDLGLSPFIVGSLLAVMTVGRIFGPLLWSILADKYGNRRRIIQFGALAALISFTCLIFSPNLPLLTLSLACFSFFWTAMLPQLETLTSQKTKGHAGIYSRIRMWGSLSFIVCVVLSGFMFESYGVKITVELMTVSLLLLLFISSFRLPIERKTIGKTKNEPQQNTSMLTKVLKKPCLVFLLSAFLLQFSFAVYYGFFSIYLSELDYSGKQIGILIAFGVICEIVMFYLAGPIFKRFKLGPIFTFCFLITALRWLILADFADSFVILFLSQSIHAFSFALHHVSAQQFIRQYFNSAQQSRGQAIYIACSFGLGITIGSFVSGYSWQWGANVSFYIAALACFIAALLMLFGKLDTGLGNKR